MNKRTAEYLNLLHCRANAPLVLSRCDDSAYEIRGGTATERLAIEHYIEQCRQRVEAQAVREEIMRAAAESREADTYTGGEDNSLLYWGQVNGHAAGAGGIALALVMPDILREIGRLNSIAEQAYEAYRLACVQGVAIPPAKEGA